MHVIWTLSLRGNIATKRQVVALAAALQKELGGPAHASIVSYFPALGETGSDSVTLRQMHFSGPWPDIVISCRPEVTALAVEIRQSSNGKTRLIVLQPCAPDDTDFDLSLFDLIIAQPQEHFHGGNVLRSQLALHGLNAEVLQQITAHSTIAANIVRQPLLVVLVGGSDEHSALAAEHYAQLAGDIATIAETHGGSIAVLTSRRTGEEGIEILKALEKIHKNILVNNPRVSYEAALALAKSFIVTAESLSMVSEALATQSPVALYDFNGLLTRHHLHQVFATLEEKGELSRFPDMKGTKNSAGYDELPVLARKICERLGI